MADTNWQGSVIVPTLSPGASADVRLTAFDGAVNSTSIVLATPLENMNAGLSFYAWNDDDKGHGVNIRFFNRTIATITTTHPLFNVRVFG